jgi:hypothetical protein
MGSTIDGGDGLIGDRSSDHLGHKLSRLRGPAALAVVLLVHAGLYTLSLKLPVSNSEYLRSPL